MTSPEPSAPLAPPAPPAPSWKRHLRFRWSLLILLTTVLGVSIGIKVRQERRYTAWRRMGAAVKRGDVEAVSRYLDVAPELLEHTGDVLPRRPLHVAVRAEHEELAKHLIARGAKVNFPDTRGRTVLWDAAALGNAVLAKALLEAGADPDVFIEHQTGPGGRPMGRYWTVLHMAIDDNRPRIVGSLIDAGADLDGSAGPDPRIRPLHLAVKLGRTEIAKLLVAGGADVNAADTWGSTALHRAAACRRPALAGLLAANGADLEARTEHDGATPLHSAAVNADRTPVVEALLRAGADPSATTKSGTTPLHLVAGDDNVEAARMLIAKGADVDAQWGDGGTPLHIAAGYGHVKVATLLLAHGAGANAKKTDGETPLHVAARCGRDEFAKLLAEAGADVNATDAGLDTPLHAVLRRAPGSGRRYQDSLWRTVSLLLKRGADPLAKNKAGVTPVYLARRMNHTLLLPLLEKAVEERGGE